LTLVKEIYYTRKLSPLEQAQGGNALKADLSWQWSRCAAEGLVPAMLIPHLGGAV